jgi:ABC-2 type transport system ATP-binding protein
MVEQCPRCEETAVTDLQARQAGHPAPGAGTTVPGGTAVAVVTLSKSYGRVNAVKDVSFSIGSGEVFAFLGPNGAGKTTTVRMLCTLARPSGGRASVAGFDVACQPKAVRRRIGLVFQEQTLDDRLTAEQNLRFHAVLYHVPHAQVETRIDRVLRLVALSDRRHDLVSTFSGGMARRLEIARGMLHTPSVLFLDEPTVGLDPQTRALVWEDVLRLRRDEQATIFLTTHYMDEAEYADRLAIIDHGSIVATGTPGELKRQVGSDTVELVTADNGAAAGHLAAAGFQVRRGEEQLVVFADDGEAVVPRLIEAAGVRVRSVHVHRPTLDDVFLHYTGRQIRDEPAEHALPARARAHIARRRVSHLDRLGPGVRVPARDAGRTGQPQFAGVGEDARRGQHRHRPGRHHAGARAADRGAADSAAGSSGDWDRAADGGGTDRVRGVRGQPHPADGGLLRRHATAAVPDALPVRCVVPAQRAAWLAHRPHQDQSADICGRSAGLHWLSRSTLRWRPPVRTSTQQLRRAAGGDSGEAPDRQGTKW